MDFRVTVAKFSIGCVVCGVGLLLRRNEAFLVKEIEAEWEETASYLVDRWC